MVSKLFSIALAKDSQIELFSNILIKVEKQLRKKSKKLWDLEKLSPGSLLSKYSPSGMYLCYLNNKVIGTVILQERDYLFWPEYVSSSEAYYIHKLSLLSQYRGKGFSFKFLELVEKKAIQDNKKYIRLDCNEDMPNVSKIYETFGFKKVKLKKIEGKRVILYEKKLAPSLFLDVYQKNNFIFEGAGHLSLNNKENTTLDLLSGVSTNILGFNNKKIRYIAKKQIDKYIHLSNYHNSRAQIEMLDLMKKITHLEKYLLLNSSSEANEALLTILNNSSILNANSKNKIITFKNSFFGRTYGCRMLNSGGRYGNLFIKSIPANDLEKIKTELNEKVLAIYLELIQGHGGIIPIKRKIIKYIKAAAEKNKIYIIVDETLTGLGRCNYPFLYQKFKLKPNALIVGKGLGGGFPLSVLCTDKSISNLVVKGIYGSTLGGNSVACVCGKYILRFITNPKERKKIRENSGYLRVKLEHLSKRFNFGLLGEGYLIGLRFNSEKEAKKFQLETIKNNLFVDTVDNNTIRIMPPLDITRSEIEFIINKFIEIFRKLQNE